MTNTRTEPIQQHWTIEGLDVSSEPAGTALDVNSRLALLEVGDIEPPLVPYLAAAAAELALLSGIRWGFSADDPPVALLRMIARATMLQPQAGGAHTARLLHQLDQLDQLHQVRQPAPSR